MSNSADSSCTSLTSADAEVTFQNISMVKNTSEIGVSLNYTLSEVTNEAGQKYGIQIELICDPTIADDEIK